MIDIRHQFLIFALINNRDNLIVFSLIISANGLINRCAAVQLMNNKLSRASSFSVIMQTLRLILWFENKMIQHNAVGNKCREYSEPTVFCHRPVQRTMPRTCRRREDMAFPSSICKIFIHNLRHNIQAAGRCIVVKQKYLNTLTAEI